MNGNRTEIEVKNEVPISDDSTTYQGFYQRRWPVAHYVLTAKQEENEGKIGAIVFRSVEASKYQRVFDLKELEVYAQEIANRVTPRGNEKMIDASPLDMFVDRQCWLIVELDSNINWHFSPNSYACTSKGPEYTTLKKGHNVYLRHVYKSGPSKPKATSATGEDACRVVFFGVTHRGLEKNNTDSHHYMNLKIDFFQTLQGKAAVLPVVLDPDVGNDGQQEIPSP